MKITITKISKIAILKKLLQEILWRLNYNIGISIMSVHNVDLEYLKKLFKSERKLKKRTMEGIHITVEPEEKLPATPNRYYWELDMGGLIFNDKILTYRLWNGELGYMPHSE